MEDLILDLTSGDDERAERAAQRLAEQGDAAIAALRPLLAAPQAERRWWAIRTWLKSQVDGQRPGRSRR